MFLIKRNFLDIHRIIILFFLYFVFMLQGIFADGAFFSDSGQSLDNANSDEVALGDVDGDGDLDAFVAESGPSTVWINQGGDQAGTEGVFNDSGQSLGSDISSGVALGDLDGDGDLDAFVANSQFPGQANKVWINQGGDQAGTEGVYADSGQSLGSSSSCDVALGDFDSDGDLDAFVANINDQANKVWINQGGIQAGTEGVFSDSGQSLGGSHSFNVALGDVNGDNHLDAFIANGNSQPNKVWINNGSGSFSDSGQSLGSGSSIAVALGDLDGDNDLDAFIASDSIKEVWLNQGGSQGGTEGVFVDSGQSLGSLPGRGVELADLDGDGDLDAFATNTNYPGGAANEVWLGYSTGAFKSNGQSLGHSSSQGLALGDVDGDGDIDAFVANWGEPNKVWLNWNRVESVTPSPNSCTAPVNTNLTVTILGEVNQSSVNNNTFVVHGGFHGHHYGSFSFSSIIFDPTNDFYPGEFVQTTVTDGVLSGGAPIMPYVWQFYVGVTEGTGLFLDTGQSLGSGLGKKVALGDINGDSNLDAFVANNNEANTVWLGDGTGNFTDSGQSLGSYKSMNVALGDLNGDGDLDAFVANYEQGCRVWLNSAGFFTDSGQSLGNACRFGLALGDVDGDGDLDAFIANVASQPNELWLNDGSGTFSDSGQSLGASQSYSVALGDVDNDGDLDAFIGNAGSTAGNKVWLNDGEGVFSDSCQSMGTLTSCGVSLGDVDGDGDLDAYVSNYSSPNQVWLNDGAGVFTDSGQELGMGANYGSTLGDLDGDGDLDVFDSNYGQPNQVWLNNGAGVFSSNGQSLGDNWTWDIGLGDLDGDGDLDAFAVNIGADKVWINRNSLSAPMFEVYR